MSKKLLLVEDEVLIAMSKSQMLKENGYEVVVQHNGETAVEAVGSDRDISLILIDLDLGKGIDGSETARRILRNHDLPIVFFTGHSEEEYVRRVKNINGYGYVLKNSGDFVILESIRRAYALFESHNLVDHKDNSRSSRYAEAILHANPNAIVTHRGDNIIDEWNPGAEKLFHYTRKEALGRNLGTLLCGNDAHALEELNTYTEQIFSGIPLPPKETIRYTKEGQPLHVIVAGSPIWVNGRPEGNVATYTDISRLKKREKKIELLLAEKEQLLNEVHHRIKNHMSTISSLISLRASSIDDIQSCIVLEEIQTKIKLMQNIYQTLYTGDNLGAVTLLSFLSPLLQDIQSTYIDRPTISIDTDIEDLEVTSKQSLPVGIIITELISNSIKYAFDEGDEGRIHVSIHRCGEYNDRLCLKVSDNGQGIPPELIERKQYGFGLTIVDGYARQFHGTLDISTEDGTTVSVVLKLE